MKEEENKNTIDETRPHFLSGWRFIALVATIFLTVLGYFLFTLWGGWDKVVNAIESIGIQGILTAMSIACVSYLFRFIRWNTFLKVLGCHVPWLKSLQIYIAGYSLTTTPGKAGEALRSVFLNDYGVEYRRSFGALLAERLSDLMAVVVLSTAGLLVYPKARFALIFSLSFILFILYSIQKDSWLRGLESWFNRISRNKFCYIADFFIDTILSFRRCFSPFVLIYGIFLGCIAWGLEGVILWYLLELLGIEISVFTTIFIQAFALLIGALSCLPGGLGGAEVTMYNMLIFYDVPSSTAVAATLILRLCTLWFSVLLGVIALPKKRITLKKE